MVSFSAALFLSINVGAQVHSFIQKKKELLHHYLLLFILCLLSCIWLPLFVSCIVNGFMYYVMRIKVLTYGNANQNVGPIVTDKQRISSISSFSVFFSFFFSCLPLSSLLSLWRCCACLIHKCHDQSLHFIGVRLDLSPLSAKCQHFTSLCSSCYK